MGLGFWLLGPFQPLPSSYALCSSHLGSLIIHNTAQHIFPIHKISLANQRTVFTEWHHPLTSDIRRPNAVTKLYERGFSPWCTAFHDFATACKHRWKSELANTFFSKKIYQMVLLLWSFQIIIWYAVLHYSLILLIRISGQIVWFRIKILRNITVMQFFWKIEVKKRFRIWLSIGSLQVGFFFLGWGFWSLCPIFDAWVQFSYTTPSCHNKFACVESVEKDDWIQWLRFYTDALLCMW